MKRATEAPPATKTVANLHAELVRHSELERPWSLAAVRDLLRWPPDAFAFTSLVLAESGAYRVAVSPPAGRQWPPVAGWEAKVKQLADAWFRHAALPGWEERRPGDLARLVKQIHRMGLLPVHALDQSEHWDSACALLTLHAAADEACAGVGIQPAGHEPRREQLDSSYFWMYVNHLLFRNETLSHVRPEIARVVPKLRTPQVGISLRSLSHNLSFHRSEVQVRWRMTEGLAPAFEGHLNLLLVPVPTTVENSAFRPVDNPQIANLDRERFGHFDFQPAEPFDVDRVTAALDEARTKVGMVHGVVFPEAALTDDDLELLLGELVVRSDNAPRFIIAGVRGPKRNAAALAIRYKGGWRVWYQNKHHRWRMDEAQIRTYELTSSLHPKIRWWENIDVTERHLHFVSVNGWLTFCHLICEDLARQDPVAQTVRSVGPTLVVALLQDGPQLRSRWPARYAGVLADDPGSSVLTLTSLGMALRSRPAGHPPSRVIALWKDSQQGEKEITLEEGSCAVILTTCADQKVTEWTADGRSCGGVSAQLTFGGYEQIKGPTAGATPAPRRRRARPASRPRPTT
ncbi:MAG TPA: hypothetical protein VND93_34590 [Myxococcales bacterium]|nr:hypothetical protein [Myxococcales bacterium]